MCCGVYGVAVNDVVVDTAAAGERVVSSEGDRLGIIGGDPPVCGSDGRDGSDAGGASVGPADHHEGTVVVGGLGTAPSTACVSVPGAGEE